MKCPKCGTNGIEGRVCFYCEARKERQDKRQRGNAGAGETRDAGEGAAPSPRRDAPPPADQPPTG